MDSVWDDARIEDNTVDEQVDSSHAQEKIALIKSTLFKLDQDDKLESEPWVQLVKLISDEDREEEFTTFKDCLREVSNVNDKSITGVALIHYIIVFDRAAYIELLHDNPSGAKLDLNIVDDVVGYTPLMWSFSLQRRSCCLELFNSFDEINFNMTNKAGLSAWDMVPPYSPLSEFLEQNNMFRYRAEKHEIPQISQPKDASILINNEDSTTKETFDNIDLQVAGLTLSSAADDNLFLDSDHNNLNHSQGPSAFVDPTFTEDYHGTFDFEKLLTDQYLEFSDFDIPQILNLLISLPQKEPHITTYPAGLIYQCIRFADHKIKSKSLVESLINLSLTKILTSVSSNGAAGLVSTEASLQAGDIVLQSYWLSCLSFLYYYLCRDESFFKRHPSVLQELINTIHSIIIELTSSIHCRLISLVDSTLLAYTTIQDVKQTLYKRDWNFFKKRKQAKLLSKEKNRKQLKEQQKKEQHLQDQDQENENEQKQQGEDDFDDRVSTNDDDKSSASLFYDKEILRHLYPPSFEEQMKPSPLKIVQIFGALSYVLNLHQTHPIFQQQCLSISVNWFATTLFNKILKDKKKRSLSRAHAIQIRLNLSTLESWIQNNDFRVPKPMLIDDFMWQRFPMTLIRDVGEIDLSDPILRNVATYKPVNEDDKDWIYDTSNSLFYYQPFHRIAQIHLEPVFQLLQWLQVATTLDSEESLISTMNLLPRLTAVQLLKSMEKYNYELNENKFNSKLKKFLSNEIKDGKLSKTNVYLQEHEIPYLVLPTVPEMTDLYSKGPDSHSFQPFLPGSIEDDVYEIHDTNFKQRQNEPQPNVTTFGFDEGSTEDEMEENREVEDINGENHISSEGVVLNGGNDEYFKELNIPSSTAQRPAWLNNDDMEQNPW
ncbi:YPR089W [Saccharomyces arboricola H-6]|uniref:YPR089W n=1 Tax=Saccharomyces arboricola (strain H-6 / AS 2.3317 / CBS 10644) TaxID=1160507 RepID=J8PGL6_SACAR|nr:YPR089W [Saccharomyces arboricola H-6]